MRIKRQHREKSRRVLKLYTARISVLFLALFALSAGAASVQYFGGNKVRYRSFDFKVMSTEHLDIYYYPEEEAAVQQAARLGERWYVRLATVLNHELTGRPATVRRRLSARVRHTRTSPARVSRLRARSCGSRW